MPGSGDDDALIRRERRIVVPGAVHLPDWLDLDEQRAMVERCREWARAPAPMRAKRMPGGALMSVRTVCLGWHWQPYRYSRTAEDVDGAPVPPFPDELVQLGRRAVVDAYQDTPLRTMVESYRPDAALVNYYDPTARMGMHRDADEDGRSPVVSLSIGDSCVFRFGNTTHRGRPHHDVELRSGDLFVFGGDARLAFHGVPRVLAGTADPRSGLDAGRLNLTLRVTGLTG